MGRVSEARYIYPGTLLCLLKHLRRVCVLKRTVAGKGEGGGSASAGQVGRERTPSTDAGWCARTAQRRAVPLAWQQQGRYEQRVRRVYMGGCILQAHQCPAELSG